MKILGMAEASRLPYFTWGVVSGRGGWAEWAHLVFFLWGWLSLRFLITQTHSYAGDAKLGEVP